MTTQSLPGATLSGPALAVTTGVAAGALLLGTAGAGFATSPPCGPPARRTRKPDDRVYGTQASGTRGATFRSAS